MNVLWALRYCANNSHFALVPILYWAMGIIFDCICAIRYPTIIIVQYMYALDFLLTYLIMWLKFFSVMYYSAENRRIFTSGWSSLLEDHQSNF